MSSAIRKIPQEHIKNTKKYNRSVSLRLANTPKILTDQILIQLVWFMDLLNIITSS